MWPRGTRVCEPGNRSPVLALARQTRSNLLVKAGRAFREVLGLRDDDGAIGLTEDQQLVAGRQRRSFRVEPFAPVGTRRREASPGISYHRARFESLPLARSTRGTRVRRP